MSELLPTLQAASTQSALVEYVTTAIEFKDRYAQEALTSFLSDREHGIFRGPYLRTRLPFREAPGTSPLGVLPSWFQPYAHQSEAFRRLTTDPSAPGPRDRAGLRIPEPTIVTTGTGSGKTEAFLYPLLDYAVRARAQGVCGIKAIILYPMNALANDQAARLARMIHENPALRGLTAALYTGEHSAAPRTAMSEDSLIEDRHVIRSMAPDLILTNYKMLDQLLLRRPDRPLWEQSAESLRYLVLDEFHTYNGAQGTDVAMLIRRLRLLLNRLAPQRTAMIPVATSATLGDDRDIAPVADFASTIFGVEFTPDSVVTERRVTRESLREEALTRLDRTRWRAQEHPTQGQLAALLELLPEARVGQLPDPAELTRRVLDLLWQTTDGTPAGQAADSASAPDLLLAHPLVSELLAHTAEAIPLRELSRALVPHLDPGTTGSRFLEALGGALSHVRSQTERNRFPNVEVHLWIREVSRVDRAVSPTVSFSWSDDRTTHNGTFLPAIYCRHCGRTGWGAAYTGIGELSVRSQEIREAHVRRTGRFRALISQPGAEPGDHDNLRFFNPESRTLGDLPPADEAGDLDILPVLIHTGLEADSLSIADTCPSCQREGGIRFLGSRTATLLSVALSSLFGTAGLDSHEKKSLVFTDSVQDAAHRAGFVEARSHFLTLRSAIHSALTEEPAPVQTVVERMMAEARTPEQRYRLLHPTIAENDPVRGYWDETESAQRRRRAAEQVRSRLEFDLQLEAGLVESYGRTLAATGAAAASVAAAEDQLRSVGHKVLEDFARQTRIQTIGPAEEEQVSVWVRGILERLRADGAIGHPWLRRYRERGGKRYDLWGGRKPTEMMPAFPPGRRSPTFPATGRLSDKSEFISPSHTASWYVDWTARCLSIDKRGAGHLMKPLFTALSDAGFTDTLEVTEHGITVCESYGLRPEKLMMALIPSIPKILRCPVCGEITTGLTETLTAMNGGPCSTYQCKGSLQTGRLRESYYRSLYRGDMRRVIAREHTSLLPGQTRLTYETEFKNSETTPGAPNVLVATPTLEMGIDIGDLSTVILASIPTTVASYLQRVGRAGRLTGNSLDLAFMTTRGRGSAFADPEFMLNGPVRPPAAYLSAEEILHRQFIAFLMDRLAGDSGTPETLRAASIMRSTAPDTFLGVLLADVERHAAQRVDEFLSVFQIGDDPRRGMTRQAAEELREWVTRPTGGEPSGLEQAVKSAVHRWGREKEEIIHRRQAVEKSLQDIAEGRTIITEESEKHEEQLKGQHELLDEQERQLGLTENEEARRREERRLAGSQMRLCAEASQHSREHWISVLERFGLLPNFTLYDDSVTLEATLTYRNAQDEWKHLPAEYARSGFSALTELAPGNSFYADGHELKIDTVDVGSDGDGIRRVAFCPDCGHSTVCEASDRLDSCPNPRCRRPGIADAGQHLHVVELTKVSSTMELNRAKITDSSEERVSTSYETLTIPDFSSAQTRAEWSVIGTGVGIAYRRGSRLTRLNVGRPREGSRESILAGRRQRIGGFEICAECGHLDTTLGENKPQEHQGWCGQRRAEKSESVSAVLSRELTTETLMISLPPSIIDDSSGRSLWSFYAALMVGLRERFGGEIGHLGMEVVPDVTRNSAESLLLYDSVPGGTGYLAELAAPESLWELLRLAHDHLSQCPCREEEEKSACFRCLMPHVRASKREYLDRNRALTILRTLMGSSDEVPGPTMTWRVERGSAPMGADFESTLEQRFRRLFRAAVGQIPDAKITDTTNDGGAGFSAIIGEITYTFAPQVRVENTQPDFLLKWPIREGIIGAAIYLDGREFHATSAHNRVGDDAFKRRGLREQGYLVYAVTHRDLEAYEAAQRGEPQDAVLKHLWIPQILTRVRSGGMVDADDLAYLDADPITQLLTLLRGHIRDPFKRQRTVSQGLNLLLFNQKPVPVSPKALGAQALDILSAPLDAPLPPPARPTKNDGFVRRIGPLVILGDVKPSPNLLAVILDDSDEAVASPYFEDAWRIWLTLSNLRQDLNSSSTTLLETRSSLGQLTREESEPVSESWLEILSGTDEEPPMSPSTQSQLTARPVDLINPRRPMMLSDSWKALVNNALTPDEKAVLIFAARLNLPLPRAGEEYEGYPVDLAWPDLGIAWLSDPDLADKFRKIAPVGWTVTGPDLVDIKKHLESRGENLDGKTVTL